MTDHPMIFSAPMVRALIREAEQPGTGKTQTRRVISPEPDASQFREGSTLMISGDGFVRKLEGHFRPKWKVGDRLWVKESWCGDAEIRGTTFYRADGEHVVLDDGDGFTLCNKDGPERSPWRSATHLPRERSRLTLHVTAVKVERLQDISEADAEAEGMPPPYLGDGDPPYTECAIMVDRRRQFRNLWNSLHGPDAWDRNPFCCVIQFRPVLCNIDSTEARHVLQN